jgi:hypothetical protein
VQLDVRGQTVAAHVYEVKDDCLALKDTVQYEFMRSRYAADKRYPVAIEATGNAKLRMHEVEIAELQ